MVMHYQHKEEYSPGQNNDAIESYLSEIANGNITALEGLYSLTQHAVFGYALSILKNTQNAQDVMQDTYIRICQYAIAYKPLGKPMAWIMAIVRNLSLMSIRSKSKDAIPFDEEWQPEADSSQDFEGGRLDAIVLEAAMNKLAPIERQIITLHGVAGLKHREIAEIQGIPLSTVVNKYRRALKKLEKLIGEDV